MVRKSRTHGFTLVEILIVVIILGILAAIVIPKFANASDDARRGVLGSTLHALRSQIELYMLQHGDARPVLGTSDWTALTDQTMYFGNVCGPYIPLVPRNPLNGFSDILIVNADVLGGDAVGQASTGFIYNSLNGKLWATNTVGDRVFNEVNPLDPAN